MVKETREIKKAQTRSLIILNAFRLFGDKGIGSTRTIDIAKEAGVSHGLIFAHFPKREDLIACVIEEFGLKVAGRIHATAEKGISLKEMLLIHLNGLIEFEPFYTRLVQESPILPSEAQNALTGIQSAISYHLSAAAERETAEGKIKVMPFHLLFNTWIALLHYYLAGHELFAPGESVLKRYGHELLEHFWSLIQI